MKEKFDNKERRRYYGLRVGDIVAPRALGGEYIYGTNCKIIELCGGDNNRVIIRTPDNKEIDWVAEWCDMVARIEYKEQIIEKINTIQKYIMVNCRGNTQFEKRDDGAWIMFPDIIKIIK